MLEETVTQITLILLFKNLLLDGYITQLIDYKARFKNNKILIRNQIYF